jgi:branched-chain amino acid transport system permease protein
MINVNAGSPTTVGTNTNTNTNSSPNSNFGDAPGASWRDSLKVQSQWRLWEYVLWILIFALPAILSSRGSLINEVIIVALFAMSLDLILGYTGVVSLGHAAFFGFGAYTAALFAKFILPDPTVGLLVAIIATAALGAIASVTILRGTDLTRLMVTLGAAMLLLELANKMAWLTGGADGLQGVVLGPVLGMFEFDLYGHTAAWYSITVTFVLFFLMRRIAYSPFGATLMAIRDNRLRAAAIGIPVVSRLAWIYTVSAAVAGASGALVAQTTGFASLDVFAFDRSANVMLMLVIGGVGWLYGGIFGAIVFKILQTWLSDITPQYWMFWIGLILVLLVVVGRERIQSINVPRLALQWHEPPDAQGKGIKDLILLVIYGRGQVRSVRLLKLARRVDPQTTLKRDA